MSISSPQPHYTSEPTLDRIMPERKHQSVLNQSSGSPKKGKSTTKARPRWQEQIPKSHGSANKPQSPQKKASTPQDIAVQKGAAQAVSQASVSKATQSLSPLSSRQMHRFYEPLVLLYTLGQTRGERLLTEDRTNSLLLLTRDIRRRYLSDLAYICDYEKGGETVTAIGLERTPEHHIFWIAANSSPATKIAPFLRDLLSRLASVASAPATAIDKEIEAIAKICIKFGTPRINTYLGFIRSQMERLCSVPETLDDST
jgi:hypothetical protein